MIEDASPPPGRAVKALRGFGVAALFVLGAVVVTWPLAQGPGNGLPLGTEPVATVPLFNLWTLAWNAESVSRGLDGYWQAPIFHPAPDAFAFSEPQPVLGLFTAALVALGLSPVAAYGVLLIGALATNGWLTTVLLGRVGLAWLPSLFGGAVVLMLPFTHQELGVIQLVPLAGVLAFAIAVLGFAQSPRLPAGLALGGGLALAYGLSAQIAVFCALAATPATLWLWWPLRRSAKAWAALAAGVVLFFALVSPLLLAQLRATSDEHFVRSAETVRRHSAKPAHYLKSPWEQLLPTPGVEVAERPSSRAFWPGTLRVLLALTGLAVAWRSARWRRFGAAGALVLGSGVVLSFGGHLAVAGLSLADVLGRLPGLGQIRSFFRFALFAQLAVAALAAGGVHWLQGQARRRWATAALPARVAAQTALGALALVAVLEMRPGPMRIEPLPPLDRELPWLTWIEEQTAPDDVLVFAPFPEGRGVRDYLATGQWMYWQMRHWRPMVNGYSGFFPRDFKVIKEEMRTFPSQDALRALDAAGVRYCVVPRAVIEGSPPPDPAGPFQLSMVFRDEFHELAIFELRPVG